MAQFPATVNHWWGICIDQGDEFKLLDIILFWRTYAFLEESWIVLNLSFSLWEYVLIGFQSDIPYQTIYIFNSV